MEELSGGQQEATNKNISSKQQVKDESNLTTTRDNESWNKQKGRSPPSQNLTRRSTDTSTKKFTGHNRGDLEGIVLTKDGSIAQFTELKKTLRTLGGSKYMPKVGKSIELMKRLKRVDFLPVEPNPDDWTVGGKEVTAIKTALAKMYDEDIKMSTKNFNLYTSDMEKLYVVALGQIDDGMMEKLKSNDKWEHVNDIECPVELLSLLRDICYQGNKNKVYAPTNIIRCIRKLMCSRQRHLDGTEYMESIVRQYEVLEAIGGGLTCPALIKYELEINKDRYHETTYTEYKELPDNSRVKQAIDKAVKQRLLATLAIEGCTEEDSILKETLENQYSLGTNSYPATTTAALDMLGDFKGSRKGGAKTGVGNKQKAKGKLHQEATAFVTKGDVVHVHDGNNINDTTAEDDQSCGWQNAAMDDDDEVYLSSHQLLMRAIEGGEDFGDGQDRFETNSFFQYCSIHDSSGMGDPTAGDDGSKDHVVFNYSSRIERFFAQHGTGENAGQVNPNWILLDSESSCNLIVNRHIVKNIRPAPGSQVMHIHCNSGVAHTNLIADLPGFGEVWFYEKGIANLLSLALVSERFRVTMDTDCDNALHVHKPGGGGTRRFGRSKCNLYYCDIRQHQGVTLTITSVEGRQSEFSDLDCRRAIKARQLQEIMGFPSSKDLINMIESKLVQNCEVTRRDVQNAELIYGKHVSIVKGKTVRRTGEHVREDISPVPPDVLERYGKVMIHIDILTVNGIRFFHSISRHLRFRTARAITNTKQSTMLECIESLIGQYKARGFTVTQISGDNQFQCLQDDLLRLSPPVVLQCVAAGQHEPTIERSNRTLKENVRCYVNHLPFKKLPKRCVIELIYATVYWLNCRTTSVHRTKSAREIMTGLCLDAKQECRFQFMEPILAHVDDTDNTMRPRAVDALYLRPTGLSTRGFYAFDVNSGKRIHRKSATATPLTKTLVNRVTRIGEADKMPTGVYFGDAEGNTTILDLDDGLAGVNADDDDASDATFKPAGAEDGSVGTELDEYVEDEEIEDEEIQQLNVDLAIDVGDTAHTDGRTDQATAREADETTTARNEEDEGQRDAPNDPSNDEGQGDVMTDTVAEEVEPVSSRLRKQITRSHNKYGEGDEYEATTRTRSFFTAGYVRAVEHLCKRDSSLMMVAHAIAHYNNLEATQATKQYGVKEGIKRFGDAGVNAVLKELKQLHNRNVVKAISPMKLTAEIKEQALPYLMFLKRKRDTSIKGRGCADGRRQREYIRKEDAASPTVSLYALVLSCVIDAIECRDVATVDIPGAFLQTPMPEGEDVYIRLDGTMAELLCRVNPKLYRKYLINKNGKKTLFTRAEKAIYGTLRAALLFWEKLYRQLEEWGFELNPYDPCTVNRMINGKQCTIVWHVDDLKISHCDPNVVTNMIDQLNNEFGKESPLTETRGKIHDYVGMTLDYTEVGKVKFSMFDYLEEIIQNLPGSLRGTAVTPAADHLFKVNEDSVKLNTERADKFHHYVAKLLFMAKRARPDIQTAVAFLCTRVSEPDEDDWKKLKRVMSYLMSTPYIPLVLGWDGSGHVYWHVDAAFAVHNDMRSHSGGVMTFGNGAVITTCTKQKLNTKSSTEAEVVGVDDNMTFILWARYFLNAQRQHMSDNIADGQEEQGKGLGNTHVIYQDNESAIKLERNGQRSSTKRTKHINIRYFFVTDRIKKGEVTVEYCPTDEIIADYFTKPLQGSKFVKFRNTIQGISNEDCVKYKQAYLAAKEARTAASE